MEILTELSLNGLQEALAILHNEALKLERCRFLLAGPYERTEELRGHANGFKNKTLKTGVGKLALAFPQARDLELGSEGFYPRALVRGPRVEWALVCAVADMFANSVSTRRVLAIAEQLCGSEVTSSQVTRAAKRLDEQLQRWRERPLTITAYKLINARYKGVRHRERLIRAAPLIAISDTQGGKRRILGVSVEVSETEAHWRVFLHSLKSRGPNGILLVVNDDLERPRATREAVLGSVPWQRCQFYPQRNEVPYLPKVEVRRVVARSIRAILNTEDPRVADEPLEKTVSRYRNCAPKLAGWMEAAIPAGLAVLPFVAAHRRRMKTTNALKQLNEEIRRRTPVVRIFPNSDSLWSLASAALAVYDNESKIGNTSLETRAKCCCGNQQKNSYLAPGIIRLAPSSQIDDDSSRDHQSTLT